MGEQEVPCPPSEHEFERRRDINQGHVQELINLTSAASLGTHAGLNSILLMLQVFCSFKYVNGLFKLAFGKVDTSSVDW